MEILFLGTGSCTPTPQKANHPFRSSSGFLLEIEEKSLLFDIGSGALHKMLISGIDILKKPTHLFISHFHPDHSADVISLMQARFVAKQNGYDIKPLFIYGPKDTKTFFDSLFYGVEKWKNSFGQNLTEKIFIINEVEEGLVVEDKNIKVEGIKVEHFDSTAYKVTTRGRIITYSGDIGYDKNFANFSKGADAVIIECSYPNKKSLRGTHLCPEDIGRLAKLGGFGKIVLTHMYPECEGQEEQIKAKIHEFTDSEVVIPSDLERVIL